MKFEIFEQLFFQRTNAAALVVQCGEIVESALQPDGVEGLRKEVGGASADGFQRSFESVDGGHDHDADARIATKRAFEKVKGVGILKMDGGEDNAATPGTNEAKGFLGIAGGNGFVTYA